jgi:glycosyltransferase involved in cell wall biosynthesis
LTVIVPVHNGATDLEACLRALIKGDLPRDTWELIVVDDASTDTSLMIAERFANRVIRLEEPAKGPAFARNRGIEAANSSHVAFVDADVMVHADALRLLCEKLESEDIAAVFGSYDDRPLASNVVSQYRNLLHHFVHQRAAGFVESFWAGCGAAKKEIIASVGMFDEERFHRPEMEDVDLGYRLRDAGHRICLDPAIQCTHRKRITLPGMVASDFSRRGIPWTRLLLDRGMLNAPRGLSLGPADRVSAFTAVIFALLLVVALVELSVALWIMAAGWLLAFVGANQQLFKSFSRLRGRRFLIAAIPLHLIYSLVAVSALLWGIVTHPFSRGAQARYIPRQ